MHPYEWGIIGVKQLDFYPIIGCADCSHCSCCCGGFCGSTGINCSCHTSVASSRLERQLDRPRRNSQNQTGSRSFDLIRLHLFLHAVTVRGCCKGASAVETSQLSFSAHIINAHFHYRREQHHILATSPFNSPKSRFCRCTRSTYLRTVINIGAYSFCLWMGRVSHHLGISSGSESDRDCDNESSHIHAKIPLFLTNLNEAAPATKWSKDSVIGHLYSIQETAQMQGKSHCRLGCTEFSLVNQIDHSISLNSSPYCSQQKQASRDITTKRFGSLY